jgi:16S rRNA (cytosine1402-N4)-methyltransferase
MNIHKSVLLGEAIENLNLKGGAVVVDATLGSGGHAKSILEKIGKKGKLIAIDYDIENIEKQKTADNIFLVNDNFANLGKILEGLEIEKVDAVLADLGISSDQLENEKYGLTFQKESPLDMRLDKRNRLSAWTIVNKFKQEELEMIIKNFGEERFAKNIAKKIIEFRKIKKIETTMELAEIVKNAVPGKFRKGKLHPATKTFQALRIAVNKELENLEKFIPQAIEVLRSQGRLVIISFHSLEDRIVKNIFRENARGCVCPKDFPKCVCGKKPRIKIISKKPIIPTFEEIAENLRSRSAKMRICEKI